MTSKIIILGLLLINILNCFVFAQGDEFRKKKKNKVQPNNTPRIEVEFNQEPTATLKGKILDAATGEPLIGVKVSILGSTLGSFTDVDGIFTVKNIKEGTHVMQFTYIGYETKQIENIKLQPGEVKTVSFVLAEQAITTEEVVITTTLEKESDISAIREQLSAFSVKDVFASETILRSSSDLLLSNSLSRLPGVNLIEDQFLVIRGLSERYNMFTLNGAPLPITNINRQTFEFATLPTHVISQLKLTKSGSADVLGGFSGGIVEIETPEYTERKAFNLNLQLIYNTKATFNNFNNSSEDKAGLGGIFGKPTGLSFDFPTTSLVKSHPLLDATNYTYAKKTPRDLGFDQFKTLPGMNLAVSYKNRFTFQGNNREYINYIIGASLLNKYNFEDRTLYILQSYNPIRKYSAASDSGGWNFNESQIAANMYFNASLHLGGNHKISFFNLANILYNDYAAINKGIHITDQTIEERSSYIFMPQKVNKRSFYSSQISGKHKFDIKSDKQLHFNWTLFATFSKYIEPNTRGLNYRENPTSPGSYVYDTSFTGDFQKFETVFDGSQKDRLLGLKCDFELPLSKTGLFNLFKYGVFFSSQSRKFDSRTYIISPTDSFSIDINSLTYPNQDIYNNQNIGENGFGIVETTTQGNNYSAKSLNLAPFAILNLNITPRIAAFVGVRLEYYTQLVYNEFLGVKKTDVDTAFIDPLPSMGFRFNLRENLTTKLSFFESINRPEARELAGFEYFDIFMKSDFRGNPNLFRSRIYNLDWRWEYMPTGRELISASVFYKSIQNPIEQYIEAGSVNALQVYSVRNLQNAMVAGLEFDIRKRMGFLGNPYLDNILFSANLTMIRSRVDVNFSEFWKKGRTLQGQANYTCNLGLIFNEPNTRLDFGAFYNTTGYKISVVGLGKDVFPDLYELPRSVIDLQVGKKFGRAFEIKFIAQDILNQYFRRVQIYEGRTKYEPLVDNIVFKFKKGNRFMLTMSYKF